MYTRDMIVEVRPFSRQFEGEEVIIGRQETGTFLAVPAEAVDVLDCLGQGKTVGEASDLHQQKHGTIPDLDDFLSAMASSGIVRLPTSAPDENATLGEPRRVRYHLAHFPQALAQRIFSLPVLAVCCLLIAVAIGLTAWHPSLLPRVREFYFTDHRTLTLLVLVFIGYASVLVHEFAHLVAARAQGVNARLGISNRLWELVVEADLTGLWAVPKRRRYLPLLAGSLHDAVVGSVVVLLLFAQEQNLLASPAFLVRILRLSLLIYITRIGWQCFVFVRTDYYYVIASLLDCRNLLSDTEDFLCNQIARFIPWVPRVDQSALSAGEHRVLPAFAFVWAAGRIVALFWFYSVTGPILILYTLNLLRVFHAGYSANPSDFVDSVLLYLIMVVPIGVGLSLWIASLARRAGTVLSLQRAQVDMAAHTADLHRPALSRALPILILEGRAGQGRRRWIEERLQESAASGARIFFADCDFESAGPWAGVKSLFMELLPDIQAQRPDLVERHAAELVHILPQLTSSMTGKRENLTDLAPQGERVRSYAADRAFRIVHGLIDLLDRWKSSTCPGLSWVIGCDSYGQAGRMSSQFFRELMRRRGDRLGLRLVVGVNRGEGEAARISLKAGPGVEIMAVDFPAEPAPTVDRSTAEQMADMIERQIGDDVIAKQVHLADLIRLSQHAGRQEKVIRLKYFAMNVFLQLGLYEDALRYSDGLLRQAGECLPGDWELRWSIMIKTLSALMGTQKAEAAIELASEAARNLAEHAKPAWRVDFWYLFAMLYARFRSPRDFAMGEQYLDRGLAELERAGLPESESHFNYVFNRNGLAMIRTFQGRHQDALELCRSGIDRMNRHVDPDKHRLHRSVLIYNIAQVCTAVGQYEEALEHFSTVIAMDPNYSEYYNERGNLMLRLERLEEARADYLKAIELSPPYFEVFTNLGQCYRNMGNPAEAIQSYSRALDLEPERPLPLVGRAQCHEELGNAPAAIADYSAALNLDATMWDVFASRGVMHYETGDLPASLADFNRALELAPDQIGLYKNRAIVLFDLGRRSEAALDLRTGLSLNPMDEERAEMQARLNMALEAIASE